MRSIRRRLPPAMSLPAWGGGSILPYAIDFSAADFDSNWSTGATWSASGSQAVNTGLTLGSDLLTNPSMEAGDPPTGWLPLSAPTLSSAADERTGGSGSACLNMARNGTSNPLAYQAYTASVGEFFRMDGWHKRIDCTNVDIYIVNTQSVLRFKTNTDWANAVRDCISTATAIQIRCSGRTTTDPQSSRFDDVSFKQYTAPAQLFRAVSAGYSLVRVGANITMTDVGGDVGVVACLDSATNPQNYVFATLSQYAGLMYLIKVVAGVPTIVDAGTSFTYVAGAALEIRHTAANTFQVWYNDGQLGADRTISDAGIISNTRHGLFSGEMGAAGGFDAFFLESV